MPLDDEIQQRQHHGHAALNDLMRHTHLAGKDPRSDEVNDTEHGVAGQKPSQRGKLITAMAKGNPAISKEAEQGTDAEDDCHRSLAAHDPPRHQEVHAIDSGVEAEANENVAYELRADHLGRSNMSAAPNRLRR